MGDLADYLDDLAMRMDVGAKLMHQQATRWEAAGIDEAESLYRHARSMRGAVPILNSWSRGVRNVPAPGTRPAPADIDDR